MSVRKIIYDRETWRGLFFIVSLSVVLGIVSNLGLIKRFLAGEFHQAFLLREDYPGLVFITLTEVEDLWHNRTAAIVDSRSASEFDSGHIPGAISVPLEEINRGNFGLLEKIPRDQPLVIYCEGGDCLSSLNLARLLHQRGFRDLRVFSGGWEEWTAAGLPVVR